MKRVTIEKTDGKVRDTPKEGMVEGIVKKERHFFSESDVNFIKQRWTELSSRMNDRQITGEIAKEKGWKAGSVMGVICRLRKIREIGENPNKRETREFSSEEINYIKLRWIGLSVQGMNDWQIMKEIAKEKGWNAGSVWGVICRLRKIREIGENPVSGPGELHP